MVVRVSYGSGNSINIAPLYGDGSADVVGTAAGGFALTTGHVGHIDAEVFNGNGVSIASGGLAGIGGQISRLSNGNLVTLDRHGDRAEYTIFDSTLHVVVPRTIIANQYNRPVVGSDLVGLVGGGFVAVSELSFTGTDHDIHVDVIGANGSVIRSFAPIRTGAYDYEPSVAAMDDGGFVVAWTQENNGTGLRKVWFATYNANGTERTAPTTVGFGFETNLDSRDPSVAALAGGGFALVYTETSGGQSYLQVLHTNAGGGLNGFPLTSSDDGLTHNDRDASIARLPNGLLAISYSSDAPQSTNTNTNVIVLDPVTDKFNFAGEITGGASTSNDVANPVVTAFSSQGDIAVFHTDVTTGKVVGEIDHLIRYSVGDDAPDTITGDSMIDFMDGGGGNDTLRGGGNNDNLRGGAGGDTMIGGAGDDTYGVDDNFDSVQEFAGEGYDSVISSVSYTLPDNVERLSLLGNGLNINGMGNGLANLIAGDDGANRIDGRGGADTMAGGGGIDIYMVDNAGDVVIEGAGGVPLDLVATSVTYTLGAGVEVEVLQTLDGAGTAAINLTGNEFVQSITGNDGVNRLDGKAGADTMTGRGGNDTYIVDNAGDVIVEGAGQGTADLVATGVTYTLGAGVQVESLQTLDGAGTGAINLTGNEFVQRLTGNDGVNRLDGKAGADTMVGRGGNDVYIVDNAGDVIVEGAGQGTNDVVAALSGYALGASAQIETLQTGDGASTTAVNLYGNGFAQTIIGNNGANQIAGGLGLDVLQGRGGADLFLFNTPLSAGNVDRITDFSVVDDTIRVDDAVFTGLATGALAANAFVIASSAQDAFDRIIYNSGTGALSFDQDGTGAIIAVQFATPYGSTTAQRLVMLHDKSGPGAVPVGNGWVGR